MAAELCWFPFYPKDFAGDGKVEAMNTLAVGAYILLLCKAWAETPPASVPDDDATLARWSRVSPEVWTEIKPMVLAPFTPKDGRLVQRRLLAEWKRASGRSGKARKSAEARWTKTGRNADAMRSHSDGNTLNSQTDSQSQIQKNLTDQRGERKRAGSDCLTDCPDRVSDMLDRLGVREPARSQLAACAAITPTELRERWRRLNADLQIKNPLAAFVHETRAAHALDAPPRRNGNLSPSTVLANRRLLQRREQQK